MPDLLAVHTFHGKSGLAEDRIQNSFAFSFPGTWTPENGGVALKSAISDFFVVDHGVANASIKQYLGAQISRTAFTEIDVYDITGKLQNVVKTKANGQEYLAPPNHGSPVYSAQGTSGGADPSGTLPAEVSVAITLRGTAWQSMPVEAPDGGDPQGKIDRPKSRHTGRLYIGPLSTSVLDAPDATGEVRVSSAFRTVLLDACDYLAAQIRAQGGQWCIWSRQDGFLYTITDVQVDNAFDTQRRRGVAPSIRDTRDVSS